MSWMKVWTCWSMGPGRGDALVLMNWGRIGWERCLDTRAYMHRFVLTKAIIGAGGWLDGASALPFSFSGGGMHESRPIAFAF